MSNPDNNNTDYHGSYNSGQWNSGDYNSGDCNTGNHNSGSFNTGNYNTGYRNSGSFNTGNCNTGHRNLGHHNSGDRNIGHYNSGSCNIGCRNSGNHNSGQWNLGHRNSGNHNSGKYNSGSRNSGSWNSGDHNSGHYNSGNYNSGYFCSADGPVMFFNKPWEGTHEQAQKLIPDIRLPMGCEWVPQKDMTDDEKHQHPSYRELGGYLRTHKQKITEAFPIAWAKMDDETRQRFLNLPNFDPEIFLACTGVDVRTQKPKTQTNTQKEDTVDLPLTICQWVVNHFEATDNPTPDQQQARERELVKAIKAAIAKAQGTK